MGTREEIPVSAREAKREFMVLLRRGELGEHFVITRDGSPVARLAPWKQASKMTPQEAADALIEFRRGRRLNSGEIREMIEEGRQ